MAKKLKPVHPGEILHEEFMKPLRLKTRRGEALLRSAESIRELKAVYQSNQKT